MSLSMNIRRHLATPSTSLVNLQMFINGKTKSSRFANIYIVKINTLTAPQSSLHIFQGTEKVAKFNGLVLANGLPEDAT